jgi:hypothetical protein
MVGTNSLKKRPTLGAKETYYMLTFDSFIAKEAHLFHCKRDPL